MVGCITIKWGTGSDVTSIVDSSGNGRTGTVPFDKLPPKISSETLNGGYKTLEHNKTLTSFSDRKILYYGGETITPTQMSFTVLTKWITNSADGQRIVSLTNNIDYSLRTISTGYTVIRNAVAVLTIPCNIYNWNIITVSFSTSGIVTAYLNGDLVGSNSYATSGSASATIGWLTSNDSVNSAVPMVNISPELLIYNRPLTAQEVLLQHRYLKFKYNI